jgi:indolepyruvate ferredoxin oxidoreductase
VTDPDALAALTAPPVPLPEIEPAARRLIDRIGAEPGSELERLLIVRVPELISYQSVGYARRYARFVRHVREHEERAARGRPRATEAVARQLYRLMAYKDEYEVARLHLDPRERARLRQEFGDGATFKYMLQPPLLRSLGMRNKVALGGWFDPALRALRALRIVRGTPLDLFGYTEIRRIERSLVGEYQRLVQTSLPHLAAIPEDVFATCELPDLVRGYEGVKLRNVAAFRERADGYHARFAELAAASYRGDHAVDD